MQILLAVLLYFTIFQVEGLTVKDDSVITVSESTPIGTLLGIITISDDNGRVTVYSDDYRTNSLVVIKPVQFAFTGTTSTSTQFKVILNQMLDYERESQVQLHFSAVNAVQEKVDFQMVLNIEDENDERPIFDQLQYSFNVSSSVTPGSVIGGVRAIDRDSGLNSALKYTLKLNPEIATMFVIDSASGLITILEQPESNTAQLSFVVRATDSGTNIRFTSDVMVTVHFL